MMMVTAYGDEERRRHAADAGALQFLTKPVDFDFLKAQLRQLAGAASLIGLVSPQVPECRLVAHDSC